jgi:hypothetical protein
MKHEVGDRLVEHYGGRQGSYCAGRVVGIFETASKPDTDYLLLMSDSGAYTVYANLRGPQCRPWVPREIPADVFRQMAEACINGVELPPERKQEGAPPAPAVPRRRAKEDDDTPPFVSEGAEEAPAAESDLFVPGLDIFMEVSA